MKNSKLIKILIIVSVLLILGFGVNFLVYKKTDYNFITNTAKTLLNNLGIYTEEVNELEISSNSEIKKYNSYFFTEFSDKNKITLGSFVQSESNLESDAKDYVFMVDTTVNFFSQLSDLMNIIKESNSENKITKYEFDNNDVFVLSPDQLLHISPNAIKDDICFVWMDNDKEDRILRYRKEKRIYNFSNREEIKKAGNE